ncbi:MAG: Calx-beta domain-containing protein, partial [Pseudomonadota bacterium]
VSFSELNSSHFEWRANQLEDNVASRIGLSSVIDDFQIVSENVFSGKSVAMAGGVDRAPYHSGQGYAEYTGTPISDLMGDGGTGGDDGDGDGGSDDSGSTPIVVTVTGGAVTESDPGMVHVHDDGTEHEHDDGHRYITFQIALDAPAATELTLSYATADGTAVADTTSDVAWDYHEAMGSLIFAPGEQIKTVVVAVHPDTLVEDVETFTLSVSGANISGTLQATGTIYDNDSEDPGDGMGGGGGHDMGDGNDMPDMGDGDDSDTDTGTYEVILDDWGSGFVARFYLTPGEVISGGWTASIATLAEITNVWNAEIVSHENGILALQNAAWNGSIGSDETIEVGVQGNGSAAGLELVATSLPLTGVAEAGDDPIDGDTGGGTDTDGPVDNGTGGGDAGGGSSGGDTGPFVGGGVTYTVGATSVVTGFDPTRDVLDLGPNSIHNQIPVDTADGFMMLHMFNPGLSMLVEGVWLADLHPENFVPISDSHLQQDLSAVLAYEDSSGLVRPNTVYVRSHQEGLVETVDFDPATDKISFFYLSVRGDGLRNFAVEDTAGGARFFNPLNGQSLTLNGVSFSELNSSHFEWRANQLEDNVASRIGLSSVIDDFQIVSENVF